MQILIRKLLLFSFIFFMASSASAKVYWLPDYLEDNLDRNDSRTNELDKDDDRNISKECSNWGMISASERGNKVCATIDIIPGVGTCYTDCTCPSQYKYTEDNCTGGKKVDGSSCDEKYDNCVCDASLYPETSCPEGEVLSGASCDDGTLHYEKCIDPCEGLTDQDCGEFSCKQTYASCSTKCEVCETDNCSIREDNTGDYGCEKMWDDCATKCEIPYKDNCHKREDNTTEYGCDKVWDDCATKCEVGTTCSPRDCSDYTLSSCPANATCDPCTPGCGNTVTTYKFLQCNIGYWDLNNFLCNGNQLCTWKIN